MTFKRILHASLLVLLATLTSAIFCGLLVSRLGGADNGFGALADLLGGFMAGGAAGFFLSLIAAIKGTGAQLKKWSLLAGVLLFGEAIFVFILKSL